MVGGRTRWDASELTAAAEILHRMPRTAALLADQTISCHCQGGDCL